MEQRSAEALAADGKEAFDRGEAEASRLAFEAALAEGESGSLLPRRCRGFRYHLGHRAERRRGALRARNPADDGER
jgi:hypothetical protein